MSLLFIVVLVAFEAQFTLVTVKVHGIKTTTCENAPHFILLAKRQLVKEKLEQMMKQYGKNYAQWIADAAEFETSWESKKLLYKVELIKENVLTKPQIEAELAKLKIKGTPVKPRCVKRAYSHDGPIRRIKREYIRTMDQSGAGSASIFAQWTNQAQETRVYSHEGPIGSCQAKKGTRR
eukprot:1176549-Prorocentrum_minimum.AAC.2